MSYYVLSDKKEQIEAYSKSEVYSKAEADSKLDSKLKELLNTIYPKGSIYIAQFYIACIIHWWLMGSVAFWTCTLDSYKRCKH